MDTSTDIADAGFKDLFVGTELFRALNVPSYEFSADPIKFSKLRNIAQFLNNHPDPNWVIGRIKNNKTSLGPLDYLNNYATLGLKRSHLSRDLKETDEEMRQYE